MKLPEQYDYVHNGGCTNVEATNRLKVQIGVEERIQTIIEPIFTAMGYPTTSKDFVQQLMSTSVAQLIIDLEMNDSISPEEKYDQYVELRMEEVKELMQSLVGKKLDIRDTKYKIIKDVIRIVCRCVIAKTNTPLTIFNFTQNDVGHVNRMYMDQLYYIEHPELVAIVESFLNGSIPLDNFITSLEDLQSTGVNDTIFNGILIAAKQTLEEDKYEKLRESLNGVLPNVEQIERNEAISRARKSVEDTPSVENIKQFHTLILGEPDLQVDAIQYIHKLFTRMYWYDIKVYGLYDLETAISYVENLEGIMSADFKEIFNTLLVPAASNDRSLLLTKLSKLDFIQYNSEIQEFLFVLACGQIFSNISDLQSFKLPPDISQLAIREIEATLDQAYTVLQQQPQLINDTNSILLLIIGLANSIDSILITKLKELLSLIDLHYPDKKQDISKGLSDAIKSKPMIFGWIYGSKLDDDFSTGEV